MLNNHATIIEQTWNLIKLKGVFRLLRWLLAHVAIFDDNLYCLTLQVLFEFLQKFAEMINFKFNRDRIPIIYHFSTLTVVGASAIRGVYLEIMTIPTNQETAFIPIFLDRVADWSIKKGHNFTIQIVYQLRHLFK